jgi:hypothetical protein
MEEFKKMGK